MVIVKLTGGMGNQLFQYAMGRAVANRHNVPLKLDRHFLDNQPNNQPFARRNYALDMFTINAGRASAAEVSRYVPLAAYRPRLRRQRYGQRLIQRVVQALNPHYITEENADAYNPNSLSNAPAHCYLDGYWQSEKYVDSIRDELRAELNFVRPLTGKAAALADVIHSCQAVCIHVRRTDFLTDSQQTTLTTSQIEQATTYLIRQGVSPTLFVFSDDIPWCRQHVRAGGLPLHVVDEAVGDTDTSFQLMTRCRHFILSVSTFGWWAAWLAAHPEKIVLHPRHPRATDWAADGWISLDTVFTPAH